MDAKETKYKDKSLEEIEKTRSEFYPFYKRSEKIEKLFFGFAIVVAIFALFVIPVLIPENDKLANILRTVLVLVPLAGMIVYGLVAKKIVNERARKFFITYYLKQNEFVLNQKGVSDVVPQEPSAIDRKVFDDSKIYLNVTEVRSKGFTEFTYNKLPVGVTDVAAITTKNKRLAVCFTGKFLFAKSKYQNEEPIIVYLKGNGLTLPPTNIENRKVVLENDKIVIYSNDASWKKFVTPDVIKKLEAIKTNELLIDLVLSLTNFQQFVGMGYNDPLMVPPFEKEFDSKPIEQYKTELEQVLKVMEALK